MKFGAPVLVIYLCMSDGKYWCYKKYNHFQIRSIVVSVACEILSTSEHQYYVCLMANWPSIRMHTARSSTLEGEYALQGGMVPGGIALPPPPVKRHTPVKILPSYMTFIWSKGLDKQQSIPVGSVPTVCQAYVVWWPPLDISTGAGGGG